MSGAKNRKTDRDISGRALAKRLGVTQSMLNDDLAAGRIPAPTGSSPGGGWRWWTPSEVETVAAYYASRPVGRVAQRRAAGLYSAEDVCKSVSIQMPSYVYALGRGRIPSPTRMVPGWSSGPYYDAAEFAHVVGLFRHRPGWGHGGRRGRRTG